MVASIWFNGTKKKKHTDVIVKTDTVDTTELELSHRTDDETDFTSGDDLPKNVLTTDDVDAAFDDVVREPYIQHYLPVSHGMDLKKFRALREKVFEASKEDNDMIEPRSQFMQRAKTVRSEPCIQYIDIPTGSVPKSNRKSFARAASEKSKIRQYAGSPYISFEKAESATNIRKKNGSRILRWVSQYFLPFLIHSERLKRKKPQTECTQNQPADQLEETKPASLTIVDLDDAFEDHIATVEKELSKLSTDDDEEDLDDDQFDASDLDANRLNSLIDKILADDLSLHKVERIRKIQHFHRPESDCDDFSFTNTTVNDSISGRFSTGVSSLLSGNIHFEGRHEDDISTCSSSFGGGSLLRNYHPIVIKYRDPDTRTKSTRIIL